MSGLAARRKSTAPRPEPEAVKPANGSAASQDTQVPLLEAMEPVDVELIKRQMESVYGVRLSDNDPALRYIKVIHVTTQAAFANASGIVADYLNHRVAEFQRSMDEAVLRRQAETRSDVLRFGEQVRHNFREESNAAIDQLAAHADEMRQHAEAIKNTRRSNRFFDIVLGLLLAAMFVLAGYILGRL